MRLTLHPGHSASFQVIRRTPVTAYWSPIEMSWLPSWPSFFGLPQLGIDHIFLSPGLRVLKEPLIGDSAGSDHFPVIATVGVPSN